MLCHVFTCSPTEASQARSKAFGIFRSELEWMAHGITLWTENQCSSTIDSNLLSCDASLPNNVCQVVMARSHMRGEPHGGSYSFCPYGNMPQHYGRIGMATFMVLMKLTPSIKPKSNYRLKFMRPMLHMPLISFTCHLSTLHTGEQNSSRSFSIWGS